MKRNRLLFFSGNRAEFGYLLPFFIELHQSHDIDFIVSGTHLLPPWNTINEIQTSLEKYKLHIGIKKIEIQNEENAHINSFSLIHDKTVQILKKNTYDYAFVLGDRPESFAFASAVFLHNIPLIHYAGGDVTDNAYLDSNIRHVITKMSHLHLTLSLDSKKVVEQLGEESWRVKNVGIATYDYDRLNLLPSKEALAAEFFDFDISSYFFILTYHATQYKSADENYEDFVLLLSILESFALPTIVTYPNNDTGSKKMIHFLQNTQFSKSVKIVKNLGTLTMLSMYKNFKSIVLGNSSSGLLETALYKTPTLNIGDRQGNRKRANNVINVALITQDLQKAVEHVLKNYDTIKQNSESAKGIFGFGDSSKILGDFLRENSYTKEQLMFKRFILQ